MIDLWLAGELTNAVYGWRLERRDGVTIGFTSHDRDVEMAGLTLRAAPGLEPSSIVESEGLESNSFSASGAISGNSISEADLSSGRWDGAKITISLFDWTQPEAGERILASGELGEVSYTAGDFKAEFNGLAMQLDAPIVPQTSPGCRAQFCDADCGLNRQRFWHELVVESVDGDTVIFGDALPGNHNAFAYGLFRSLDGANAGLTSAIQASGLNDILLVRMRLDEIETGDRVGLMQGCDKTLATCSQRFNNAINFRGEPYLPGNDLLTRYPGAS